jgi:hypothetical protein
MPRINKPINQIVNELSNQIKQAEFNIAKIEFVKSKFPDVKVNRSLGFNGDCITFSSASVNDNYTKYTFDHKYSLSIQVCHELEFTHNGRTETVKILSVPASRKLATKKYSYATKKQCIKFSAFSSKMKKQNLSEELFRAASAEIMKYIQTSPGAELDTKYLDPKLKKLLVFT